MTKFNVGDKVKFNDNTPAYWWAKSGQTGTIMEVYRDSRFDVKVDTVRSLSSIRRAPADCLDLVETAGTYVLVLRNPDGTFAPAAKPRTYTSRDQADKVAQEMAGKHGGDFVVFRAVAVASRPVAPVTLTSL